MTDVITQDILDIISRKVAESERITREEAIALFDADLLDLGRLADAVKRRRWGRQAFFVVNRQINPTNLCVLACRFCDFATKRHRSNAYELSLEEIRERAHGVREVHIVGGLHPEWSFEHYLEMLRQIKASNPQVQIKAFTAVEIDFFARRSKRSVDEVLRELKAAGLDALPGGGAEVFSERIRKALFPFKIGAPRWLEIHRTAHRLGIPTNSTLLYGHIETIEERVDHLLKLRALQDETGGLMSFIPLAYQPGRTQVVARQTSAVDDLRTIAVARLVLDNIPHIKAYWVTLGEATASVALAFGADDVDGTIGEERIMHAAETESPALLTRTRLVEMIREAGCVPVERDALYHVVQVHEEGRRNVTQRCTVDSVRFTESPYTSTPFTVNPLMPSPVPCPLSPVPSQWQTIAERVERGDRLTPEEGRYLLTDADLVALGQLAQRARCRHNPEPVVTFVVDTNPNYTNVCHTDCLFCAFYRKPNAPDAYWLSVEDVLAKVERAVGMGATTVLLQGGHNDAIPLDYYLALVRGIRERFPHVTPHCFTASEVRQMASVSGLSIRDVLRQLQEAGQTTLPGGGAEILSERVRKKLSPKKGPPAHWLEVHREAHRLGFRSTATMMYGHIETSDDIVEHWEAIRSLQDGTGGFTAFIPWSFKPGNTPLERKFPRHAGPARYLRMIAASRLYLDNFQHIQASWFSEGKKAGQLALHFGADDFGGTLFEENVHKAADFVNTTTIEETIALIREAGLIPAQRTTRYEILQRFDGPDAVAVAAPRAGAADAPMAAARG